MSHGQELPGHGFQSGPLRPDWGDGWAELTCERCGANWVGKVGETCKWCLDIIRAVGGDVPTADSNGDGNPPDAASDHDGPTLGADAYYGVLGDTVQALRPHSEACDPALLVSLAVQVGSYLGRGPHVMVEADRHGTSLFAVLVGQSARARKGTAAGRIQSVMRLVDVDLDWTTHAIWSGFGSGEGVLAHLADATRQDHRLLVDEREFAGLLTVANREGSILSVVIRNGWDGQPLRRRVKGETQIATDYHLSAVGHITREELARKLTTTEVANGFGNRWLWVHVYRARRLPLGGNLDEQTVTAIGRRLAAAISLADRTELVTMTVDAARRWVEIYDVIADGEQPGMVGALTNRAEAYVLRLALLYAVLDGGGRHIDVAHLEAGWALWRYCQDSVEYIWGDLTGDDEVDRLVAGVRRAGRRGLTVTDARVTVFAGHRQVGPIARRAAGRGLIVVVREDTDGRPRERMYDRGCAP